MTEGESTDGTGVEAAAEKTEKISSMKPFPEVDRDADRTATDDEPTATDRTADDNETDTASQSEDRTGEDDDQGHACDGPVPCRFQ